MRNELLIIGYYFVILQAEEGRWASKGCLRTSERIGKQKICDTF